MLSMLRRSGSATRRCALGATVLLTLAACGGGGSDTPPAPPAPAPVALAVADAYTLAWNAPMALGVTDNDTATGGTATLTIDSAPKNGTAAISGTTVTYTPNAGFFGQDSFSYKLSVGTVSQSATVKLTVEAALTLQGQITDGPVPNAAVKASVGNQNFTSTADANGKYSLTVKASEPTDFVTLTATGTGAQSKVVLTSLVGEVSGLATSAKDGKLASDQRPGLDVTHLSAAQAGLIAQAGAMPKSDAELASMLQNLSPQGILDAAAMVKLVVDSGVALPGGVADTRELLSSKQTLGTFQAALLRDRPGDLDAARKNTRDDALLSKAPPTPAAGGAPVTLIYAYGEEASTTKVRVLTLRADGTGIELSDQSRSLTWKLDGRVVVVTYDKPLLQTLEADEATAVGDKEVLATVRTLVAKTGLKLSDIGPGSSRGTLASITSTATVMETEGPNQGVIKAITGGELMRRHTNGALAFKAEDFPVGTKLAGVSAAMGTDVLGDAQSNQDIATIMSATELSLTRTGQKATWKIIDGKLRVDLPQVSHLYTLLGKGPLGDSRWLLQRLDGNGNAVSAYELSVIAFAPPALDRSFWLKAFRSNAGASTAAPIFYQLLDDGRASAAAVVPGEGALIPNFRRYWRLVNDGRVEISAAASSACVVYLPNGAPGPTPCRLTQTRYWQPVAQTGNTVWVLQQGPILFSSGNEATTNRWSLVALSW